MRRTVFHFTDTSGFGGAEQALLHLLAGLDRRRWRPVLLHHPGAGLAPLLEGARALDVELRAVPPLPMGRQGAARIPGLVRLLRDERPAVFHAHLTWPLACKYGLVAAIAARVPAVFATVQLFMELPYDRSARAQQRLIAAGVDAYIAVSCHVARRLRQVFGIPERKIAVVHNAIPLAAERPVEAVGAPGERQPNGSPSVLTIARLDPQKGLDYLLDAAARVPQARFALAGDGPERARLEARARALGLEDRVSFLGYRRDIPELLARCDLFVLPSLFEGLPLAALEAMAAGRPVIATAVGGTDEAVIHGETGILVPPADPDALARAIRALLAAPALAERLASAGRARVRREFGAETMVERVETLYARALGHI